MLDKSIDGALLALRKSIIRSNGAGLAEVEALLTMRGVALPHVLPVKRADVARRGAMRRLVLGMLRDGPATGQELTAHVAAQRPELALKVARDRTCHALDRLRREGLVVREDQTGRWVWRLAG